MTTSETRGFPTQRVSALTGVPMSTLHYWAKSGVVTPSIRPSAGRRATRWWSLADLVAVRAVKTLRDAGCPMQVLRRAQATIANDHAAGSGKAVLFWDGGDLLELSSTGAVRSAVRHPGQGVLHFVAMPIREWSHEAAPSAEVVDLELLMKRDARRAVQGRPISGHTASA
jgi:DNA-binding transcriptional MerR regulator